MCELPLTTARHNFFYGQVIAVLGTRITSNDSIRIYLVSYVNLEAFTQPLVTLALMRSLWQFLITRLLSSDFCVCVFFVFVPFVDIAVLL